MSRTERRGDEQAVPTLTHPQPKGEALPRRAQVIAVTSGKGGVGKTVVSTNLAIELAAQGHKVCIFDADTGLANINIVLGIQPAYTLEQLLSGEKPLDDLLVEGPRGVSILPAASGITDCVNLNQNQRDLLIDALRTLESRFDYLLIDTGAGIDETVLQFVRAAHHAIVVISPEPTSLTDAFALIKVLVKNGHAAPIHIVINKVANSKVSHGVFERFRDVIRTYLNFTVGYLGFVIADNAVKTSIIEQSPVVTLLPESVAARCFNVLAAQIPKLITQDPQASDFTAYWRQQMEEAGPADTGTASAQDALRMLREQLQTGELDDSAARALIEPLIRDFIEQYVDFPFDVREALYTTLEMENFPKLQLLELITNLEAVYHRRHHDSLRSAQDLLAQLLASAADDELAWKTLARQLQSSFKRRFNKDLF